MRNAYKFVLILLLFTLIPIGHVAASSSLPFNIPKNDYSTIKPVKSESLFSEITSTFSNLLIPAYDWGINIITIIFICATLIMTLSALFKNGQWQKYGQVTMMFSFISILLLRALPIVVLSIRSSDDVSLFLNELLTLLGFGAVFLCLISIAVSFLFHFGYRLIEHPDFHRWSKTLRGVALLMVVFAIIIPRIFLVL